MTTSSGTEEPTGRLGAVLRSAGERGPVKMGRHGPWLATTLQDARQVLTSPEDFDFPTDVSRRALASGDDESSRSGHSVTPPLRADQVARGRDVFDHELDRATERLSLPAEIDAMWFLREPVGRSTTAAVLPDISIEARDRIADLVNRWIDALGPVIASARPPGRWSRARRRETLARLDLEAALRESGCDDPARTAVVLAAGTQVPIAAGAWMLVHLAEDEDLRLRLRGREDLDRAVAWETVRLRPPTWITARVTRAATRLGATEIPASMVVWVSPLLLGQLDDLVPTDGRPARRFDPFRWDQETVRPGAWLPFGAGPHACPGRNLGLAQMTSLAAWSRKATLTSRVPAKVDQSRGIFPDPARLHVSGLE